MIRKPRRRHWWLGGAVVAILLFLAVVGDSSVYRLWKLDTRVRALKQELAEREARREALAREVRWLESDSTYMEKVAREKYKMGLKGERIFLIEGNDQP